MYTYVYHQLSSEHYCVYIFLYKEELKQLSANSSRASKQITTKPSQCFGTPTVDVAEGVTCTNMLQPRSARRKNRKLLSAILVLLRKYTDFRFQQHRNNITPRSLKAGCLC